MRNRVLFFVEHYLAHTGLFDDQVCHDFDNFEHFSSYRMCLLYQMCLWIISIIWKQSFVVTDQEYYWKDSAASVEISTWNLKPKKLRKTLKPT